MSEGQVEHGYTGQEIAVVGLAGRFPGAGDVEQLWRNLGAKVESIHFFTDRELEEAGVSPELMARPDYVRAHGLLTGADRFDAAFFGFSPREAEVTDPQYRLFLECAWEALENAGYDPRTYPGAIGVYAGAGFSSYAINVYSHPEVVAALTPMQVGLALDKDYLATRVSYKLGLRGPSLSVQTACSTSLVCVHLACQSLLAGECDMALAGGVSVPGSLGTGYLYHEGGIYAPDGHCRAFDARARGTVAGSGLGIVVLKRLEEAREDGDRILAVIKGSAINNDGDLKIGYTAPSIEGQAQVIRAALEVAEVAPETVGYVETHGTGTPLGDPVEIAALTRAFRATAQRRGRCALGSIKSNLGHLDTAAGVAGLIKTVLALDRKTLPPSLHFEEPNPQIDFAAGPFFVNTQPTPWEADGAPRRAGVSSFGIGGTNAHVVLEEAPPADPGDPARAWQLLVLSARSAPALERRTDDLVDHLAGHHDQPLADVAYTLQVGRSAFEHRRIVVCQGREQAMALLAARDGQRVFTRHQKQLVERPLAFLFPGQGTQRPGMLRELYAGEPVVARWIDRCAELLRPHLGLDLRTLLAPPEEGMEEAARRLAETELAQPALFAVEYALARLWMDWVGAPEVMLGHSLGEYVAACLAGVFPLEEALRLVAVRGRLMQGCAPGAMLAVELAADEVTPWLGRGLSLAAVNGPRRSVVSGDEDAIFAAERELSARGVQHRRLRTSRAFHSSLKDPILGSFEAELRRIRLQPPQRPFISNLTGAPIRDEEATDPGYWVRHLRYTVRFGDGLGVLWQEPHRILLEVGPGGALTTLARRHPARPENGLAIASLDARNDAEAAARAEPELLLTALGRLWLAGVEVRWTHVHAPARRRRLALPAYPFERQRYWLDRSPRLDLSASAIAPAALSAAAQPADPRPEAAAGYSRLELDMPYEAPRNGEERAVAECWELLLGIQPLGAHDDFFALGGDSLLAAHMAARLRERFRVDLALSDLLATPTVAGVAASIGEARRRGEQETSSHLLPALVPDPEHWHEPFPLTDVQQAYWVGRSGALELGNVATHVYEEIDCTDLDLPRLERALRRVIERQPMLRAIVMPDGLQRVLPQVEPYRIAVMDLTGRPSAEAEDALAGLRRRMSHQVLACDRWPLFEVRASRLDERRTRIHWSFDLLLGDAWSFVLLFSDLSRLYRDPVLELPPLAVSQRDYVLAELELRRGELHQRSVRYWQDRLATLPPAPELPLARRLGEIDQPRFTRRRLRLDEPAWTRLKARAGRTGVTPSGLLLAIFGEVLAVWSKSPRFTLDLTLFNRLPLHPQIDEVVGDFTSLLLLEVDASGDDPFEARAQRLQRRLWEDLDHRSVSGVHVMRELARVRGGAGQVAMPFVFTSLLGLRPPGAGREATTGDGEVFSGEIVYSISQTPQVLFDFQVSEVRGALACNWDVVDEAFPDGLVDAMLDAARRLLARLADDEETWRHSVRGLLPAAQLELRQAVNATARPLPRQTLDGLFAVQAAQRPQQPAILASDRTLTYAELDRRSDRLARRLRRLGARPNRLVAVMLPKGWRQVVAVLAIARAGAAYLPIDPALPAERLLYLLAEGEVEIALCDRSIDAAVDWPAAIRRLWIEAEDGSGEDRAEEALAAAHGPDDLAYVIFTSGSTGQPKGVMIEHAAAVNTLLDINERFAVGPQDRVLALSSLSFDLSVYDVFGLLAAGGALVIPEPEAAREPARWLELIERHRVTIWNSVPALLEMLVEHVADRRGLLASWLRLAMLSGDWIPLGLPDRFRDLIEAVQVVSLGGATEASIWSIVYPIDRVDPAWPSVPYGRPLANQTWDVLDHRLAPRPVWVPGELYIGGVGLARGYWRDEEKTSRRFLVDPGSGRRLYRTGDLGRYLPDGTIEFLGREDLQVKVQGHRIELGEIEAALAQHPDVLQAVVVVLGDPRAERRLAACVVAAGGPAAQEELASSLRRKLPAYMVPADWLFLEALPLTANGKVDRQALIRIAGERRPEERGIRRRPLTPAEELLAGMFRELLGRESLEADDDFFGAGGDSLKATQLASRVREVFGVELPLRQIFLAPTVAELAAVLLGQASGDGASPGRPPLLPVPREGGMPLSFAQQRLWFIDQLEPGGTLYNLPVALRAEGPLDPAVLASCLGEIVRRHEVLRTVFAVREGAPVQVILPAAPSGLSLVDLSELPEVEREALALALARDEATGPFDLERGPLLRGVLLRLSEDDHVVALTLHHIVSDGWSLGILVREVAALYAALTEGRPSPLPELAVQYADFAAWQTSWLRGEVLEEEISFWRRRLAGLPPLLELPTDRPRSAVQSFRGASRPVRLRADLIRQVEALGRREGATLFMVLLAGFQILLACTSGQDDLAVGSPIAGRNRAETEGLIGFFVNTLVLRADLAGAPGFAELLARVRRETLDAYAHQDLPFEKLVGELAPERSLAHTPLFQAMLVLQNAPAARLEIESLRLRRVDAGGAAAQLDLALSLGEYEGALAGTVDFATDLFDATTVDRLILHFRTLLSAAAAAPETPVAELPWLTAAERHQALAEWNDTQAEGLAEGCLHQDVAEQAARTPGAVAVELGDERWTYRRLLGGARRLARHLRSLGVGPDAVVGLCAERSPAMVMGMLAVLEAGGAWLPLDPAYPAERVAFLLDDAGARILLIQEPLLARVPAADRVVVPLGARWDAGEDPGQPLGVPVAPDHLAYVIYTSGSTGRPKGVMVPHRGICNRLRWSQRVYRLDARDAVLQKAPLGFDISIWECFAPLLAGARLVLAESGRQGDAPYLARVIREHRVTHVDFAPSLLAVFLDEEVETCRTLRQVFVGGEALTPELRDRALARLSVPLDNQYGPTEISIDTARQICAPGQDPHRVPIGRPIANSRLYVVDPSLRPLPAGVAGELLVGGAGLARGYLRRPGLTAERFVPDPFGGGSGARLYRTGDLARWLPDGSLDFLGRLDHQVKVRGFRIELGEIEAALVSLAGVREAAVVAREDRSAGGAGGRRLVAYVVADTDVAMLRRSLRERLPDYLVPAAFVSLAALPRTPNGKVDRKALPEPERQRSEEGWRAPRTPVEEVLAGIWAELLGLERVGAADHFFDLGGHSLLATRVMSRLRGAFGVELPLRTLFEAPVLADLAARIEAARFQEDRTGADRPAPPLVPLAPALREGPLPLSFAQQRLWFIHQLQPASPLYNLPAALRIDGALDRAVLALCLGEVVRRHEVLRTVFAARDGAPVQVVRPAAPVPLPLVDLSELPETTRTALALALLAEEAGRPFDLGDPRGGPLLRGGLLRMAEEDHFLTLSLHHIVSDGWSLEILVRELASLYAAFAGGRPSPLPALPVQYADFAAWQGSWLQGEILEGEISYWRRQLAGLPPLLDLPTDRPRPPVQSFRGAARPARLPAELTRRAAALARREGATLFMVLLAGFQALLARTSGQRDLAVGSPVAGRNRVEIEGLIGFFVNTLVLRGDLAGEPSFRELLGRVRETALAAHTHQDLPFEKLVQELAPERSLAHAPLFQVMLVLQNAPVERLEIPGLHLRPVSSAGTTAKFDLTLSFEESAGGMGGLVGTIEYATDLFDAMTIDRLIGHYELLLTGLVEEPACPVGAVDLLTAAEALELRAWNETAAAYAFDRPLHAWIEDQVDRAPAAVAVTCEGEELSYRELDRRANRLARRLRALGVGPEARVAVCLERSAELVVALLAVLKAGGAYVPLDPEYPRERLAFMLADARPAVLLSSERLRDRLPGPEVLVAWLDVWLDREAAALAAESGDRLPGGCAGDLQLAYIIYTSGSTGRPKGAMVSHRSICNRLLWMQDAYRLTAADAVLQKTPFSFDVSVWEFFWPLLAGSRLVVARPGGHRDAAYLTDVIAREKVTVLHFVPSMLQTFLEEPGLARCRSLRKVVVSGETLGADLAERLFARLPVELENLYGPTETAVDVTAWGCRPGAVRVPVPIGRPIANTAIHVLDPGGRPVPAGVAGELHIGGINVGRGYLARPDLTAERFVPDPFGAPGARLYRTGDLARFAADGAVEFLGRLDHQVKIRGFRIEPGEIEAALVALAGVREAIVVVREDRAAEGPADRRLVAYVTGEAGLAADELRRALRERLPEHMVPAAFVTLAALPLTPNGKVDRKALPAPEPRISKDPGLAPGTPVETVLAGIWCEVLGVPRVGFEDNFFDLGGHSLLLPRVQARVRDRLGREVSLVGLLTHTTVRALARSLDPGGAPVPAPRVAATPAPVGGGVGAIAIVGLAGRFPGARNVEQLWANLCAGVSSIARFSDEELAAAGVDPALRRDPRYVPAGGALDGIELFDADFFGYSPREAEILNPQHRLFLECAWEALEDAGYDPRRVPGPVGTFAGLGFNTYLHQAFTGLAREMVSGHQLLLGNDKDFLPTRVSYKLDLKGPSMAVQTACSSSLVAVHLACQNLLLGDCDMALAGGVTIDLPQRAGYLYEEEGIASPDGCCRAFDAGARGTVPGSGVGIVVLKRLEDALAQGDTIRAVIRGSAVNNDGSGKAGYTAPSVAGQDEVITRALAAAGVDPATVSYVEAHGTGTVLGDPIEVQALARAFRRGGPRKRSCALGSIKSNLGHLDAAAGVAGLIKAALALQHGVLPPSLGFSRPNPQIDFAAGPFHVQTELADWERGSSPRRAGVSSFGIGGTNAHAVLEEPPVAPPSASARPWHLLVLSARTPAALEAKRVELAGHLSSHPDIYLADAAYTLQVGRRAFPHRWTAVVRDTADAAAVLHGEAPRRLFARTAPETAPQVVFLVPGQGSQRPGMGAGLYRAEPVFRRDVDRCCEVLLPDLGFDLRELLLAPAGSEEAARRLAATEVAQPALFVIEHALARLWMGWGVRPQALIGHSIGEYVAACLAGVFSLEDALGLVAARGRLVASLPPGAMLAVSLPEPDAARRAEEHGLAVAAVNAPKSCVLSGPVDAVERLGALLAAEGIEHRRLRTSHAFHSAALEPILERFRDEVARRELRSPGLPWISNLSGTWVRPEEATSPGYWTRHLRATVRFAEGVEELVRVPGRVYLEIGPGRSLSSLVRQRLGRSEGAVLAALPQIREPEDDARQVYEALGRLWLEGVEVDWPALHAPERRRRIPLPVYPFERRRFWVEGGTDLSVPAGASRRRGIDEWLYLPSWRRTGPPARPSAPEDGAWLLFADAGGCARALSERLERSGRSTVLVAAGDRFARHGDGSFTIDPRRATDYASLLSALREEGREPEVVVHGWSLAPERPGDEGFAAAQELGLHSLLHLVRTLNAGPPGDVRLCILSNGLHEVTGVEELRPAQAGLLAVARVAPQENPGIACRVVDLECVPDASSREMDLLCAELAGPEADPLVAYRGGHRWVQAWEPVRAEVSRGEPIELRRRGVYLITGGLGKIGLTLAELLAESVQARLVLLGRTPLPERGAWPDRLRALEELGAEVLPLAVDVADRSALEAAVRQAEERFGRLDGVIHAAARIPVQTLDETGPGECASAFHAKVHGARALAAVLRGRDLDFVLAFSSLSSVLGGLGFTAYAAASLCLDAFVLRHRREVATPWISVCWDGWRFPGDASPLGGSGADAAMTPDEGKEVFRRILALGPPPHLAVSITDLEARLDRWIRGAGRSSDMAPAVPEASLHARPEQLGAYEPPRSETESILASLWQGLLGVDRIGVHDSFFELGGHSLMATRLLTRIRETFAATISLRDLFEAPVLADLAARVEAARRAGAAPPALSLPPVAPRRREGSLPLSLGQQRLWFLDRLEPDNPFYNCSDAVLCRGPLDLPLLERCFDEMVRRHEILRTVFPEVDGQPVQAVRPPAPLQLPWIDLAGLPAGRRETEARRMIAAELLVPFDLARWPLLRVRLFRLSAEEHVVGLSMHHIIWDGSSTGVLVRDLMALYQAFAAGRPSPLGPLSVQYADFACWQQEHVQGDLLEEQLAYWRRQLEGVPPRLELATDRPRPEIQGFRGGGVPVDLPADLVGELRALSHRHAATLFMTLLAAFDVLLHAHSGSPDIVVTVPSEHRGHPELEPLIGFFVNMLPLRTRLSGAMGFAELIGQVRKVSLDAFDHMHVPFDRVVHALRLPRDLAYSTLTQVSFTLGAETVESDEVPDLVWTRLEVEKGNVQYELNLSLAETGERLSGVLEYSSELFDRSTAVRYVNGLELILRTVVARPDVTVRELEEMLAESGRQDLLATGLRQLQRARRRPATAPAAV